jgi:hypothetical protein
VLDAIVDVQLPTRQLSKVDEEDLPGGEVDVAAVDAVPPVGGALAPVEEEPGEPDAPQPVSAASKARHHIAARTDARIRASFAGLQVGAFLAVLWSNAPEPGGARRTSARAPSGGSCVCVGALLRVRDRRAKTTLDLAIKTPRIRDICHRG